MNAEFNAVLTAEDQRQQQRKVLVLEALSKLADQFARDPNLQHLIDATVLTVAGQFAVANALLVTGQRQADSEGIVQSATGRYRDLAANRDWILTSKRFCGETPHPEPFRMDDPAFLDTEDPVLLHWQELGVRIFVPLAASGSTIGVILLGPRVTHQEFSYEDMDLLKQVLATITPLLANSLIYADMAILSARHTQILDSVRQAIFVFDATWHLNMANRAAEQMTRSLQGDGTGQVRAGIVLESVFPDDLFPGWAEQLRNHQFEHANRLPTSMIAKGRDHERVFSVAIRPRIGVASATEGVILTLDDKTQETASERRMFELEKFAERGVMASSISHELNNHLGIILGGVELALAAQERGQQAKVLGTLTKLRENISRMERFTAGLMDYARVNPQKQETQINDVVVDVISFAVAQKRFSAIKLNTNLSPRVPVLQVDRDQIAQVIINTLNNAADAIAETGRRDGIILVSTAVNDGAMLLSISDNGRGMTPDVKERLFKEHLTTKPKGHGFGLTTCARVLEHHGADFSIESRVGFGTTFVFRFPIT